MERHFFAKWQKVSSYLLPIGESLAEDILKDLIDKIASPQASMWEKKLQIYSSRVYGILLLSAGSLLSGSAAS